MTGFGGTGSSAVTDFVSEYNSVATHGDFEVWLLQGLWGLVDLEHFLLINPHRHKSGYALDMFRKYVQDIQPSYERIFGAAFREKTNKYIAKLELLEFDGFWSQKALDANLLQRAVFWQILPTLERRLATLFARSTERYIPRLPRSKMYMYDHKVDFLKETRSYLADLLMYENSDPNVTHYHYDQLVPSQVTEAYSRLLPNVKIILVDRDPRDLYVIAKYIWKREGWIPTDVKKFVNWYAALREASLSTKNENVMKINFEDLIYKFEKTSANISKFYGLSTSDHVFAGKYFDRNISIKNTQIYKSIGNTCEVDYISQHLEYYLYE